MLCTDIYIGEANWIIKTIIKEHTKLKLCEIYTQFMEKNKKISEWELIKLEIYMYVCVCSTGWAPRTKGNYTK